MTPTTTFSGRDRAILRLGTEADLFLDGRCRYDQPAAHLVRADLLATAASGFGRPTRRHRPHPTGVPQRLSARQ